MCTRVVTYACLCAYTYVCAYGYSYGDIAMCIYMFVSLSACLPFWSVILTLPRYILISFTSLILLLPLCTFMLYNCDRSTPGLNSTSVYMRLRTGSSLVHIMACRRLFGAKPLPEPIRTRLDNIGTMVTRFRPRFRHLTDAGPILGLHPANERRRYKVTPSLIGWAQTYNKSWDVCLYLLPVYYLGRPHTKSSLD